MGVGSWLLANRSSPAATERRRETGNADERAALKLLGALSCGSLADLTALSGVSAREIRRQVQGRERDQLDVIFGRCSISA